MPPGPDFPGNFLGGEQQGRVRVMTWRDHRDLLSSFSEVRPRYPRGRVVIACFAQYRTGRVPGGVYGGVVPPTRTTLILPPELKQRIKALADRERRSMHAELLVVIERGLAAEEKEVSRLAPPEP
jgi:hypothetical protein